LGEVVVNIHIQKGDFSKNRKATVLKETTKKSNSGEYKIYATFDFGDDIKI